MSDIFLCITLPSILNKEWPNDEICMRFRTPHINPSMTQEPPRIKQTIFHEKFEISAVSKP